MQYQLTSTMLLICLVGAATIASGCTRSDEERESTGVISTSASRSEQGGGAANRVNTSTAKVAPTGQSVQHNWHRVDDPWQDGWNTEAFNLEASKTFNRIGELLGDADSITAAALSTIVSEDYTGYPLVPTDIHEVYRDDNFVVRRLHSSKRSDAAPQTVGRQAFAESLRQLAHVFAGAQDFRFKFKIFQIREVDGRATTRQYVELSGRSSQGIIEQHATWEATWEVGPSGLRPLASVDVIDFEQTQITAAAGSLFTDCTRSILAHNDCYDDQLLYGLTHWLGRTQNTRSFTSLGTPGIAVGDINGDGLDDLYLCQEQGIPNRLFLQQPDGTLDDASKEWNIDLLQNSRSALILDLDNDGDQDLAIAHLGGVALMSNEGNRFQLRDVLETSDDQVSISAADFDSDGDLDIYASAYYPDRFLGKPSTPGAVAGLQETLVAHDANTGGRNTLHRNDITGDSWAFVDATEETGLDSRNSRLTLANSWDDFDNDGDLDLYVANDFGRDNFYRNDGGKFVEISETVGAEDSATGMGITWGDFNRDGKMDAHVSNMWSSAGGRITFQDKFKPDADPEVKRRLQRTARGNTLLRNNDKQHFEDVSAAAHVEMGRWAWASQFADINNDRWEDIIVCNGYITGDKSGGDL